MKKISIAAMMAAVLCSSAYGEATFQRITSDSFLNRYGGTQVFSISRNGRYMGGTTYIMYGFVYDADKNETLSVDPTIGSALAEDNESCQIMAISDNGIAVGSDGNGAIMVDMNTSKYTVLTAVGKNYVINSAEDITADGTLAVGFLGTGWYEQVPVYWENGEMHRLPYPNTDEAGFKVNGCAATKVSADGKVIMGKFIANPNTYPLIIWERDENGDYQYVDVWKDLYEPVHELRYDYEKGEYNLVKGPNPWMWFQGAALSADGKTIAMYVGNNYSNDVNPIIQLGFYDVEKRELTAVPVQDTQLFLLAGGFEVWGISNDGSVAGIAGSLAQAVPYVKWAGEQPAYINDLFPDMEELQEFEDWSLQGEPYVCSGMSANGRYITGYCTEIVSYVAGGPNGNAYGDDFGFIGYRIDTGEDHGSYNPGGSDNPGEDSVESIGAEGKEAPAVYYTLDGRKVSHPGHGIYVRVQGGKTAKIIL